MCMGQSLATLSILQTWFRADCLHSIQPRRSAVELPTVRTFSTTSKCGVVICLPVCMFCSGSNFQFKALSYKLQLLVRGRLRLQNICIDHVRVPRSLGRSQGHMNKTRVCVSCSLRVVCLRLKASLVVFCIQFRGRSLMSSILVHTSTGTLVRIILAIHVSFSFQFPSIVCWKDRL